MIKKSILVIFLGILVAACGSREKPKGFAMQQDIDNDYEISDTVEYDNIGVAIAEDVVIEEIIPL